MAITAAYTDPDRGLAAPAAVLVLSQLHLDRAGGPLATVSGRLELRWRVYLDAQQARRDRPPAGPGHVAERVLHLDAAELSAELRRLIVAAEALALTNPDMADCQPLNP